MIAQGGATEKTLYKDAVKILPLYAYKVSAYDKFPDLNARICLSVFIYSLKYVDNLRHK